MRQKVGFARAMAVEPELLCLDEPFSALDVLSAEALRGELLELWTSGSIPTRAILMVSHNIEEAVFMADRIVVMDKDPGRVVADLDDQPAPPAPAQIGRVPGHGRPGVRHPGRADPAGGRRAGLRPRRAGPDPRACPISPSTTWPACWNTSTTLPHKRIDIYRLADELGVDSDQLLQPDRGRRAARASPPIEKGDITLTPLGETFAEASILARKEIFATRIRRLPIFRWLMNMLRASEKQQLRWEVIQTALELEFPPEEAERQLEMVVDWGRYAELLAYDDDEETLYLEPAGQSAVGRGEK